MRPMNVIYGQPFDPEKGNQDVLVSPINMIRQASSRDPFYHLVAHANGVPVTWLVDSAAPVAMVGQAMARRIFGKKR